MLVFLQDPHTTAVLLVAIIDGMTLEAVITDRTNAPELAERAAAAILHTGDGEVGGATSS